MVASTTRQRLSSEGGAMVLAWTAGVCLAWMVTRSPVVIPIPGSSRPETIRDSAAAPDLRLSDDEVSRLDEGWPPA